MKSINANHKASNVLAVLGTAFGFISLIFLITNIHNRVNIITSLSDHSNGSVGFDAPIQYPLMMSLLILTASYVICRSRFSKLQTVGVATVVIVSLIWAIGLEFAIKNTFQL